MRVLVLVLFICVTAIFGQDGQNSADDSPLQVLESKWQRDRKEPTAYDTSRVGPVREVINENRNFRRKAREQLTPGALDPNEMTVDGRSAAMDKAVQESRTATPKPVGGYSYNVKVRNLHTETAEVVFWEYRFTELANPANVVRRQFVCAVKIKPNESKDLRVFTLSGPSDVISAESLAGAKDRLFDEKVLVHRIEYSSGAILQRKDWNFTELKPAIEKAVGTPWGTEICRAL